MRHRKDTVKLGRTSSHRKAMFRNMVTSLFKYDRIRTTDIKAKELRRWADELITLAKRGDLHARRQAAAIIREKDVLHKLFEEAKQRFGGVSGGYTRIVKIGRRPGDAAPVSLIELIAPAVVEKKKKTTGKPAKAAKDALPSGQQSPDEKEAVMETAPETDAEVAAPATEESPAKES